MLFHTFIFRRAVLNSRQGMEWSVVRRKMLICDRKRSGAACHHCNGSLFQINFSGSGFSWCKVSLKRFIILTGSQDTAGSIFFWALTFMFLCWCVCVFSYVCMFVIITTEKNNGGHVKLAKFRKGGNRHGCELPISAWVQKACTIVHTIYVWLYIQCITLCTQDHVVEEK